MNKIELTSAEQEAIVPGEAITLAAVMAILAVAVMAVVVYKLFRSDKGSAKIPGGFAFEWK
ncbi:MAG: hypothetical protein MJ239_02380 [Bacilli bacterium]|nr:hypothetical protein [Bacilli bacterium]